MRRKDREIIDKEILKSIINRAQVCRIAMSLNDIPYIIPANFGFKDNFLYIHSAIEGKKIDILTQNKKVCIEIDIFHEIIKSEQPCKWSTKYQSVICYGEAEFIESTIEKINAMNIIMDHYSPCRDHEFKEALIEKLLIIKFRIEQITGKQSIET